MNIRNAHDDETMVVAPQVRTPEVKKYLAMVTSLDPVIGTKSNLDVDQLFELAQNRTGAVSLRADSDLHFEGLRCLAASIQRDPHYDEVGRSAANHFLYSWISRYIQFERDLTTFPDIFNVPVPKPMFIVGYGRTGSTFLHHLLALDPEARAPQLWELTEPSPPPRSESYRTDPRIRRVQMHLISNSIALPDLHKIHEYGDAQVPEECHIMMWHGPHHLTSGLRVPEYWQWLRNLTPPQLHILYSSYRLQVQHLQLFHQRGHWVSKALSHACFFPVLFKIFPDARIVRLHRDPCQIVPALASIISHLQILYTSRVEFHELGRQMLDIFLDSMQRSMQIDKEVSSEHFVDVVFDDLIRDPIGTVRGIYSRFGYPYTAEFESNMRKHLQSDLITRKYKHVYTLEQFGLSRAQILARSEEYLSWVEQRTGSRLCRS
jgi:Sulfotransferase family